jgi:hypothetical protein
MVRTKTKLRFRAGKTAALAHWSSDAGSGRNRLSR